MSIDKFVDDQISKAMAEGEFDDLKGKGKPIDLSDYFSMPEDRRVGYKLLKDNKIIPEETQLLAEIENLKKQLEQTTNTEERTNISRSINNIRLRLNLLSESSRRRR